MSRREWQYLVILFVGFVITVSLIITVLPASTPAVTIPTLMVLPTEPPAVAELPDTSGPDPVAVANEPLSPPPAAVEVAQAEPIQVASAPTDPPPDPATDLPTHTATNSPTAPPTLPPPPTNTTQYGSFEWVATPVSVPVTIPPVDPVPGQIVVQFAPEASEEERAAYVEAIGGTVTEEIAALDAVIVTVTDTTAAAELPSSPVVAEAEPDYFISAAFAIPPNDPLYGDQWALQAINAPQAWAALPADAPRMPVAVIDSGICAAHPDMAGRILPGYDFVQDDTDPQDDFGHGCAVSGIIAANADDAIGIAGAAPNAMIMPLRVLDASGMGLYSDVAAAITFAADNGAQVINLSLGGAARSSVLEAAIDYAIARGVTVVAAAGNTGGDILFPAAYEPVISVGAVDQNLQLASFSARGADVVAPGVGIQTTDRAGTWAAKNGTSFAAPYVAGALASSVDVSRIIGSFLNMGTDTIVSVPTAIPVQTLMNTPSAITASVEIDFQTVVQVPDEFRSSVQALMALESQQSETSNRFYVTAFRESNDGLWARLVVVPAEIVEAGWENFSFDALIEILAHRSSMAAEWTAVSYEQLDLQAAAADVPADFIDFSGALTAQGTQYQFPWPSGYTWWKNGGQHTGYYGLSNYAIDFQAWTRNSSGAAVLAASGGTLDVICGPDSSNQLWYAIRNAEGSSGYGHLDAGTARRDLEGRTVVQGQFLAVAYSLGANYNTPCGYGAAAHIHFVYPNTNIDMYSTADDENRWVPYSEIARNDGIGAVYFRSTNNRVDNANSCTSSPSAVRLFDGVLCNGSSLTLPTVGEYDLITAYPFNDRSESMELPSGWSARLFLHGETSNYAESICVSSNVAQLSDYVFPVGGNASNNISAVQLYNVPNCTPPVPTETNLVRNGDFSGGGQNWIPNGDIDIQYANEAAYIRRTGTSGGSWELDQYLYFSAVQGQVFEASAQFWNTSTSDRFIQITVGTDRAPWSSVTCGFIVPPNTGLQTYTLRGALPSGSYPGTRLVIVPNTVSSTRDVVIDNVTARYRPSLVLQGTECISPDSNTATASPTPSTPTRTPTPSVTPIPTLPSNTNLIVNGDFTGGYTGWLGYHWNPIAINGGAMEFSLPQGQPYGVLWQQINRGLANGTPLELSFDLQNTSSAPRTLQVYLRDQDWGTARQCNFTLPANMPMRRFTMQALTGSNWGTILAQWWWMNGDGGPVVRIDNIDLRQPSPATFTGTTCSGLQASANENLIANGDFGQGYANWLGYHWNPVSITNGAFTFGLPNGQPWGVLWQEGSTGVPNSAPLELSFQLANTASVSRSFTVYLRSTDWNTLQQCSFTVPANLPMTTYRMRIRTGAAFDRVFTQFWLLNGDGQPPMQIDDVVLRYRPELPVTAMECTGATTSPTVGNLIQNPSFNGGFASWWGIGLNPVYIQNAMMSFDIPAGQAYGTMWQEVAVPVTAGTPLELSFNLGNTGSVAQTVRVFLRDLDWGTMRECAFTLPANAAMRTYSMRAAPGTNWGRILAQWWLDNGDGSPAITIDDVSLYTRPGTSTALECSAPLALEVDPLLVDATGPSVPTLIPTATPSLISNAIPTATASATTTAIPTATASVTMTVPVVPTLIPTATATSLPPTEVPPTAIPTAISTDIPTEIPTVIPTATATEVPPTAIPTEVPTEVPPPTEVPTVPPPPTAVPTEVPTEVPPPTAIPTDVPPPPTDVPTEVPPVEPPPVDPGVVPPAEGGA